MATQPASADVVVVGAGVVGAMTALDAARRGLSVVVLDRSAVASGTTGAGEGNILVSDKYPGAELDLALLSRQLWLDFAASVDHDVELDEKGGVVVTRSPAAADELWALACRQEEARVVVERLDSPRLAELEPHLAEDLSFGVHYPQDLQVQPMLATAVALREARLLGAKVLPHTPLECFQHGADGALTGVRTPSGSIAAPAVVNAAGSWAGDIARLAGSDLPIQARRGFILVTAPAPPLVQHKVYDADYVADVATSDSGLQSSAVVEATRSGTILIGATRELVGFDRSWNLQALRRLATQAVRLFPALGAVPVIRAYQGYRPYLPDHLCAIGADARVPGLLHACGHEGAGIGLAPGTARLIGELLVGDPSSLDLGPFAPARFSRLLA